MQCLNGTTPSHPHLSPLLPNLSSLESLCFSSHLHPYRTIFRSQRAQLMSQKTKRSRGSLNSTTTSAQPSTLTPPPRPELHYNPDLFEEEDVEELLMIDIYDPTVLQRSDALNGLAIMNFDTPDPTIIIDGQKYQSKRQNSVFNNYVYTIDVEKDKENAQKDVMGAEYDNDVVIGVGAIHHHLVIGDPFINIKAADQSRGNANSNLSTTNSSSTDPASTKSQSRTTTKHPPAKSSKSKQSGKADINNTDHDP